MTSSYTKLFYVTVHVKYFVLDTKGGFLEGLILWHRPHIHFILLLITPLFVVLMFGHTLEARVTYIISFPLLVMSIFTKHKKKKTHGILASIPSTSSILSMPTTLCIL